MSILFDLLLCVYIILYLPVLILRGKWHGGFKERLGFLSSRRHKELAGAQNIWVHAVSVGEVMAIEGILDRLQRAYPQKRIVLSVTTKTGYALAQKKYTQGILLLHAPIDFTFTVRAFVRVIRPVIYVAAETEIWPNLFRELDNNHVPIVIINGRISDEAYPRYRWVKGLLRATLRRVRVFCMQSALDAQRIEDLGAAPRGVVNVGNVKFDNMPSAARVSAEEMGFSGKDLVLVGGSTHPGEEEILLDVFESERRTHPDLRLVLAPRHPERAAAIAEMVQKRALAPVFFSQERRVLSADDILIVDTIGQLLKVYAVSTIVFVGKSLTVQGGHNIIEPAFFAKPVVIGPHMQNFKDITRAFLAENAVIQVQDHEGFQKAVSSLLQDAGLRSDLGRKAAAVVRQNQGATGRTMGLLQEILG